MERKLPETLGSLLKPEEVRGRHGRLMFQDEARFGRMVRIRRCWALAPKRPSVANGYEREFVYVYGAVSPRDGELDWMICGEMNTNQMGSFLARVSAAHPDDFMIMVVDGANSHRAQDLQIPENIRTLPLAPYAPEELNPQEQIWDELRKREFPIRVFYDLPSVWEHWERGLTTLSNNQRSISALTAWPWVVSLNVNAT